MGAGTLGDTLTAYIKPSLGGEIVLRKKSSNQTSKRLKDRQDKLAKTKGQSSAPGKVAHDQCKSAGKTVSKKIYKPGTGYVDADVCPIKQMKGFLREAMKKI